MRRLVRAVSGILWKTSRWIELKLCENQRSSALLIDIDNCPNQIEELPRTLGDFSKIIGCYGGSDPKVHLSLIPLLASAMSEGKLEIVRMKKNGKNAADFGLAFWAGKLAAEMPPDTEFLIFSQDSDLDYVAEMLRSADRKVKRINGRAASVTTKSDSGAKGKIRKPPVRLSNKDAVEKYFSTCLQTAKNRPAKKIALSNSIKSFCRGQGEVRPETILRNLIKQGVVVIDEQERVSYPRKLK